MNPAYSVILFTTASGAGYGLLALLGLVGFNHGPASSSAFALTAMVIALGLITIGLLSSTFHLGRPERAWRALSQWRSSWLSREAVAAIATYPIAFAFGAAWAGLIDLGSLLKPLALATTFMCFITVVCTGMIYRSLKTIRAWNSQHTVPVYICFALATGSILLMTIATIFGRYQIFQTILAVIAVTTLAIIKWIYWRTIDEQPRTHTMAAATGLGAGVRQWEMPHTATNFIMKEMGYVVARRNAEKLRALVMIALVLTIVFVVLTTISPWFSLPALVIIAVAAWTERWLFFAEAEHVVGLFYGKSAA